ncbi:MAG: hypothetical protein IPK26_19410 [Planctomycetes bacterium]|nr:hypothetical protein [Planctomycetota bacterium]
MAKTPLDDLLHRVNNLLATIQLQAEVARMDGGLPSATLALRLIAEAAERTLAEVQRFRTGRGDGQGGNTKAAGS